jgi:hypothetical protein
MTHSAYKEAVEHPTSCGTLTSNATRSFVSASESTEITDFCHVIAYNLMEDGDVSEEPTA